MKVQNQTSLFQVSEIQVSYQPKFKACDRPKVTTSKQAYDILIQNWDMGRIELNERFCILLLNRRNHVIGIAEISRGGLAGTVVDPKLIFSIALKSLASYIVLCHNHPSGDVKPSQDDVKLTSALVQCGKVLDLLVIDHIVLGKYGYYSFGDEGLL